MNRRAAALLLTLAMVSPVLSQSRISSADIQGSVADQTGAVIPGASVSLANIDTGIERGTRTESNGEWRFLVLPPGAYELRVRADGFAVYTRRPLLLTVGESASLDVRMQPATVQQEILVQDAAPVLEALKVQQSDTITQERVDNLPINERNFLNFALLTPGVSDTNLVSTFTLPQAPTSGLSFLGQNGRLNSVTIDGADNNDDAVGAVRSTLSQDAVQEFQVNRVGYGAEFGRSSGGSINIVSRSGTNAYHGTVFSFLRNQALDARNAFAFDEHGNALDPNFSRLQAGFTMGGPVKRDEEFFFLSYEGLRQRDSRYVSFLGDKEFFQPTAAQTAQVNALLSDPSAAVRALGAQLNTALTTSETTYPGTVALLRGNSGAFPFRNNDNTGALRIDHRLTAQNQMFVRTNFTDTDTTGGSFGGLKARSRSVNYKIQDWGIVFGDSEAYSSKMVNEFRFQFAHRQYDALPADPFGPEITINGVAALGRDFFLPSMRTEKRYQFSDGFTLVSGRHELKFGGDFHYIPFNTSTSVFMGGRFIFGNGVPLSSVVDNLAGAGTAASLGITGTLTPIQAFNFGIPLVFQQGFGDPHAMLSNRVWSAYIQDAIHATKRLTFNLGLRYDMELQPAPIHRDSNNIGPRLGFAYSPDERTVVRGGYGVYFAPILEGVAFIGRVLNGQQISQVLGVGTTAAQVWGLIRQNGILASRQIAAADIAPLGLQPGLSPPVLLSADAGIVNPYSQQFSFGVDRNVAGVNVSANYLGSRGVKLLRSRNVNLRLAGSNAYGPAFAPVNPAIFQDNRVESSGSSIYHGMTLSAERRFSGHLQFQASYTLGKALDDTTDFITDLQAANQLDLRAERSLSSFDQRHRLVVSGILLSPLDRNRGIGRILAGLTLAPIYTRSSGRPFNVLLGFDANGDTQANTDRPVGVGRNTGHGPGFSSLDLRVAREFRVGRDGGSRLEVTVESFNLLNSVNYSGVNNIVGTTTLPPVITGLNDRAPTKPLGFTSAFDPRQIQLGARFRF